MKEDELTVIELTEENIESMVYEIREQKVMLDFDLARIYGYKTRDFNNQVKHNSNRFPEDFMFRLNKIEWNYVLRLKKTTANELSSKRRYNPYVFTEQGIYMLMTVLKGELAVKQSKALIRLFKRMKDYIVESNNLLTTRDILELSNQVHMNAKSIESLKRKDAAMEKKLTKVMDNFIDPSKYKEFVFLSGEKLEADIAYQSIYGKAHKSIYIIDDYIDVKTLYLLRLVNKDVSITIISDNKAKNSLTSNFINDFRNKYVNNIKLIKTDSKCHDRLIIIDYKCDNETIYICGSSSKDAGNKATTIVEVTTNHIYYPLLESLFNNEELVLL